MFLDIWAVYAKFEEATKQLLCRFREFGNMLTTLLAHLHTFIHLWVDGLIIHSDTFILLVTLEQRVYN